LLYWDAIPTNFLLTRTSLPIWMSAPTRFKISTFTRSRLVLGNLPEHFATTFAMLVILPTWFGSAARK
jgi:hypothetical protein